MVGNRVWINKRTNPVYIGIFFTMILWYIFFKTTLLPHCEITSGDAIQSAPGLSALQYLVCLGRSVCREDRVLEL